MVIKVEQLLALGMTGRPGSSSYHVFLDAFTRSAIYGSGTNEGRRGISCQTNKIVETCLPRGLTECRIARVVPRLQCLLQASATGRQPLVYIEKEGRAVGEVYGAVMEKWMVSKESIPRSIKQLPQIVAREELDLCSVIEYEYSETRGQTEIYASTQKSA